jgi:hypothetical protein
MLASDLLPAIPRAIRTIREGKKAPPMNLGGLFGGMGTDQGGQGLLGALQQGASGPGLG